MTLKRWEHKLQFNRHCSHKTSGNARGMLTGSGAQKWAGQGACLANMASWLTKAFHKLKIDLLSRTYCPSLSILILTLTAAYFLPASSYTSKDKPKKHHNNP